MKKLYPLIVFTILFCYSVQSIRATDLRKAEPTKYYDAKEFTLIGKGNKSGNNYYHRVDTANYTNLPKPTKKLLTNASGLIIAFKTNSTQIDCKWKLSSYKVSNNMTAIAHSGLDLYIKENGEWLYAGVGRPSGVDSHYTVVKNMTNEEKECLLYLPLYNTLEKLEIGIDNDATISSIENPFKKKIVFYGSSITQGASASRAGLSYPARIGRNINAEIINLGLSGRGLMEKEAAQMTADIPADLYVLDCAPNPSPEIITERTNYLVKHIRSRHPKTPIIMIQSVVREIGNFDQSARSRVKNQNINFKAEYQKLINEGVTDLYLVEGEHLLGHDHEGTTDGTHPNDIGFSRMIEVIQPAIVKVLNK